MSDVAPTAEGTLARTPLAHLLVYILERGLSGTLQLQCETSHAQLLVQNGGIVKVRTSDPVAYLGDVLLGLGVITEQAHADSAAKVAAGEGLHGKLLVEMGALTPEHLVFGLHVQVEQKLQHLFDLPPETMFAYYDGMNGLGGYGGDEPVMVDPYRVMWWGICKNPQWEHCNATLNRIGDAGLVLATHAQPERLFFGEPEVGAIELLRARPTRMNDLVVAQVLPGNAVQLFFYCLLITKQVEIAEVEAPAPPPEPPPRVSSQPAGPLPVARMKLQTRPAFRPVPVAIEETAVTSSADDRVSHPVTHSAAEPPEPPPEAPVAPLAPPAETAAPPEAPSPENPSSPFVIASKISGSEPTSMPPFPVSARPTEPSTPAAEVFEADDAVEADGTIEEMDDIDVIADPSIPPPAAAGEPPPAPPAPPAQAELSPEHAAMKTELLERADKLGSQDYFQMLDVERTATKDEIQKAYLRLAKVWHPDRLPAALADVKDACGKLFAHVTEASTTLLDDDKRSKYMVLLAEGGSTNDEQELVQNALAAAMDYQKADFFLKKNDLFQAETFVRRAHTADPTQADYLALLTWLEAQKSQHLGKERTLDQIATLDKAIAINKNCERAYFYRGMLYKRVGMTREAVRDLKQSLEINPRSLDSARELRLVNIRKDGPAASPGGKGGPPDDSLGGLFGKLFKK